MSYEEDDFGFEEDLEPISKTPAAPEVSSKTPALKAIPGGKKVSLYFMSTIGPGEKKQKLLVDTGNVAGDVKTTVGNIFGLNPREFHLSSGGVTLDERAPLKDYKIGNGDEILLIPASTAGKE